jgi:hypothetical protein
VRQSQFLIVFEHENNNVLKKQGYYLEHNYGHGQQYLAAVGVMLIRLAFLFHSVLQLRDEKYRRLRAALGHLQDLL